MHRITRTIELAKASWQVLKADKELIALPVMSGVASLVVAATFMVPLFARSGLDGVEQWTFVEMLIVFAMYIAMAYVTIFFNAALVHAADERMRGGDPTIGSALRGAASRAGRILPWAIISATVSIILRAVQERAGVLGRIVIGLVGLAWSLVTFLVIPVLVLEDVGAFDAIKRSADLFKRTWGENVAASFGFGILGFLAILPSVALVMIGAAAGGAVLGVLIFAAVAWGILVVVVIAALSGVFQTALYHYAVSAEVPGQQFPTRSLAGVFPPKQARRSF